MIRDSFSTHLSLLPNIKKKKIIKNTFWKIICFLENIIFETNIILVEKIMKGEVHGLGSGHIWVWCGCSWTRLEKVKVWINTRVINVTRIGGHESKSCHVTFLLILMCWETIGCKPCGDVDHAEENSTQIFNYIYIYIPSSKPRWYSGNGCPI